MRRVLAGVISFAVGAPAYFYGRSFFAPRVAVLAGFGLAMGTYYLIDWLGLLPSPFEPTMRSLLHDDQSESDKGSRG